MEIFAAFDKIRLMKKTLQKTFGYAFSGIKVLFLREWKFWLYSIISIILIFLALICNFHRLEMIILIAMIGLVWAAEAINTIIEMYFDYYYPEQKKETQILKDASAAFVLICVITASIVGILLFYSYVK